MKIEITNEDYKEAKYDCNKKLISIDCYKYSIVTYDSWNLVRRIIAKELLKHDPEYTEIKIRKGKFRFRKKWSDRLWNI